VNEPIARIGAPADEPAVHTPALAMLVDAARRRRTPTVRLDADQIRVAWVERQRVRRRTVVSMLVAAGIGVLAFGVMRSQSEQSSLGGRGAPTPVASGSTEKSPPPVAEEHVSLPEVNAPAVPEPVRLAEGIRVSPRAGTSAAFTITRPTELVLDDGALQVEVEPRTDPVRIELSQGRALEISVGVSIVEVAGDVVNVEVVSGSVVRIEADGTRHVLGPRVSPVGASASASANASSSSAAIPSVASEEPGPAELARIAERELEGGDRAAAIKTLGKLVRKYPRSAAGQTGLLDLARLLKSAGRRDEARCAYATYLERWPRTGLRNEVERALTGLGEGTACRGLTPR
jgi:hypothetical protein